MIITDPPIMDNVPPNRYITSFIFHPFYILFPVFSFMVESKHPTTMNKQAMINDTYDLSKIAQIIRAIPTTKSSAEPMAQIILSGRFILFYPFFYILKFLQK